MKSTSEKFVIDSNGKKTAVIIPLDKYEQLMEDLHDLAVVAERRDEETISLEEITKKLKISGVL